MARIMSSSSSSSRQIQPGKSQAGDGPANDHNHGATSSPTDAISDGKPPASDTPDTAVTKTISNATLDFPEGGLKAWLVVLGSFCAMSQVFGLINSAAVFESYFAAHQLVDYSPSSIGWIFSLYLFLVFFVGIQVGPIFDRYGARALVAAGSTLIVASLMLPSISKTYYQIILTYSVLGGLGGALLNCPAYGAIAHFFNARRGLATGIATTAGGVGGIIYPMLLRYMLPRLGFAWSCRILGFIMLGLAIPANLFIRTRHHLLSKKKGGGSNGEEGLTGVESLTGPKSSVWPDFNMFRDMRFALAALGIFFMELGLFIPLTFIVSYAAAHGQDANESYVLLSYLNAGSVVGRLLPGFLADKVGRFNVVLVTLALCTITPLAMWLPADGSRGLLTAYAVLFGFASGSNLGLVPVCLGQLCDAREYGRFYTTAMMVASFGTLASVPIGGALLDIQPHAWGWRALILFSGLATKMAGELSAPPVLSTPAEQIFEHVELPTESDLQVRKRTDDELREIYEIARTAQEIRDGGYTRVALQFPDSMLGDAPWVVQALNTELSTLAGDTQKGAGERIYILADTSYSACCVDEVAAEHVNADVVIHYGRSCLSPTSRLPVIYVFTRHPLDLTPCLDAFVTEYPDKNEKVVVVADVTYQDHVQALTAALRERGCRNVLSTEIVHDPTGRIPNRRITNTGGSQTGGSQTTSNELVLDTDGLRECSVFHISSPPTALLLALSSRVRSLCIYPTTSPNDIDTNPSRRTRALLGRRYARLLSLASAGIIGILVNTLSVSNYLSSIDTIRKAISAAGKKSYTVVVGKLNPAKLANFAEVDGWVVVGCWESSLVEDDAGFYRPVITPFELEVALQRDDKRVWGGEWWGGIETIQPTPETAENSTEETKDAIAGEHGRDREGEAEEAEGEIEESRIGYGEQEIDDEESEPPEFDLRTGRLISHSRPMRTPAQQKPTATTGNGEVQSSSALALRQKAGEVAMVNGVVSPGAEYLRSQRTWQGLGTDLDPSEDSAAIEEGRSGVARGYTVGESDRR
ncbi:major facilitator superfamily domain-containing protein [Diplogelasinospora grovesii]|uniref:2-(3-amino-3-carboxypropyl)histidine synthase subunit 2 n=1 Tax=Diplogelasinospora grovesii TaxID=303347 RepID=A0AAN6N0D3_9PEZI|nr:major facilitator superfamily domain-containing protein [Diplogelasinospora grovesii]